MPSHIGTKATGLRAPIIKEGDAIDRLVVNSLRDAVDAMDDTLKEDDVIAVSEAVVARAEGNYVTVDEIAKDLEGAFGGTKTLGVLFPILSRNRFSLILKGIARSMDHIHLMLSYPSDEVGNRLVSEEKLFEQGVNPWSDVLDEATFRNHFGYQKHPFTGVDYIEFYKSLIEAEGCTVDVHFSNNPSFILEHTDHVLTCDIHTRTMTKRRLLKAGVKIVKSLDDLLNEPVSGKGYNPTYGLLGSNKSTEERLKLFPRDGFKTVKSIQNAIKEAFGIAPEVMIYGDGAFKDPIGGIWELADPVVSPGYTEGLEGAPNELKLKYIADNELAGLQGEALEDAMKEKIRTKDGTLKGRMASQGTTPRRYVDLIGSLCDLVSGSGDKGTPIVWIQNYFKNYAD
ncbi:MAG: coenzyme F420-0:L-glutamate ligase [Candidatus Izemoplasmataceae bacterium]